MVNVFGLRLFIDSRCDLCSAEILAGEEIIEKVDYDEDVPIGIIFPMTRKRICRECFKKMEVTDAQSQSAVIVVWPDGRMHD